MLTKEQKKINQMRSQFQSDLKKKYNMTPQDYGNLLYNQRFSCSQCHKQDATGLKMWNTRYIALNLICTRCHFLVHKLSH